MIEYSVENDLEASEFLDLLRRSTLAERRPVDNLPRIRGMLDGANLIVCARHGQTRELVGVSRALTDKAYCTYLSDLAVDQAFQRQGIGRKLIEVTHERAGRATKLILIAAPAAETYYPHIGMQPHSSCWLLPDDPAAYAPPRATDAAKPLQNGAPAAEVDGSTKTHQLSQFFDELATDYAEAIRRCVPRYPEMLQRIFDYLPESLRPKRILELGCGTGNLSTVIAGRYPDATITAVDLSAKSIDCCRARIGSDQHEFMVADMRELEFEDAQFDLVLSTISIHHLTSSEKRKLFAQCLSWLKPEGFF